MPIRHSPTMQSRSKPQRSFVIFLIAALSILREDVLQVTGFSTTTTSRLTNELKKQNINTSFRQQNQQQPQFQESRRQNDVFSIRGGLATNRGSTQLNFANQAIASVLAGSIAGAIGVGVAFPLDTLKTKSQVISRQQQLESRQKVGADGAVAVESYGMFQLVPMIYKMEGIAGFYGGVRGMMAGQAIVKSVAFSANSIMLNFMNTHYPALDSVTILLIAACFSGFVTSFLVAPVERIKVIMQASNSSEDGARAYKNEIQCAKAVLENEGWTGLMGRGLGTTLVREIPSYGLYFFLYGILSSLPMTASMGNLAPLINGALSGMGSWVPVYPIDVVKTLVQNSDGSADGTDDAGSLSAIDVAKELYADGGIEAFFDGLTPKMLRAAVNHAVTFYVYEMLMSGVA